jgi:hypothetical protein
MEVNTGKILSQSAFQHSLGDEFSFQLDNNLKQKAESTQELLTKTVNVPEWPCYSFNLNLLENLWQDMTMVA